jgi:hypothetical protein
MRIGEIERIGVREIPMPSFTPVPPEPAPEQKPPPVKEPAKVAEEVR